MVEEDVEILLSETPQNSLILRAFGNPGVVFIYIQRFQTRLLAYNRCFDGQLHGNDYKFGRHYQLVPTSNCYSKYFGDDEFVMGYEFFR